LGGIYTDIPPRRYGPASILSESQRYRAGTDMTKLCGYWAVDRSSMSRTVLFVLQPTFVSDIAQFCNFVRPPESALATVIATTNLQSIRERIVRSNVVDNGAFIA